MRNIVAVALLSFAPSALPAQEAEPWGSRDFTFRRVAVAPSGSSAPIVQIDPEEEPYYLTPALTPGTELPRPKQLAVDAIGTSEWFWSGVSPALAAGNPARFDQALAQLRLADTQVVPPAEQVARLVEEYGVPAAEHAKGTRVSPALALAVMAVESGGRERAESHAGAQGLMQLMPATAARFGVTDALDPADNISGGIAYLNFLLRAFGEDAILALAAYNAGEGAVAQNKGVPPYAETRAYVPKVLGAWTVARLFCRVPPRTVTDPCEFTTVTAAADATDNG